MGATEISVTARPSACDGIDFDRGNCEQGSAAQERSGSGESGDNLGDGGVPKYYIPKAMAPTICLEAEREELRINAGYQDRVIQIYNGLVFMDFERSYLEEHRHGKYEQLYPCLAAMKEGVNFYVAYDVMRAEESGEAHKEVKRLFEAKNAEVMAAMSEFADIAHQGRDLIVKGEMGGLPGLINANFDLRDRIFQVAAENKRMVQVARGAGVSAKFAGSGGAIVGMYEDEAQFRRLEMELEGIGCRVVRARVAVSEDGEGVEELVRWRKS